MFKGSYIRDFRDDDSELEADEEEYEPLPKRRRGCNRKWMKTADFQMASEAEEALKARHIWKKCMTNIQ